MCVSVQLTVGAGSTAPNPEGSCYRLKRALVPPRVSGLLGPRPPEQKTSPAVALPTAHRAL